MNPLDVLLNLLQMLLWHPGTGALIALLLAAAWTDWRSFRIPNWLTVPGMVWGLAYNTVFAESAIGGLGHGLLGLVTCMALLLPLYALRVMGAGDVKLMAMVGAFLGALASVKALLITLIVGGLMALAWTMWRRAMPQLMDNTQTLITSMAVPGMPLWRPDETTPSVGRLPFGLAISLGSITYVTLRQLGYA